MVDLSGPIPEKVVSDLHALGLQLVGLAAADLPEERAREVAEEISVIRLQLKRLEADREELPGYCVG